MNKIELHLHQNLKAGPSHIIEIINPIMEKYNKYWSRMKEFAAINLLFDPRYKFELVAFYLEEELEATQAKNSLEETKSTVVKWFDELIGNQQVTPADTPNFNPTQSTT